MGLITKFQLSNRVLLLGFFSFLSRRNLSNLKLGGEISPAIGDLRNIQSMYMVFLFGCFGCFFFLY